LYNRLKLSGPVDILKYSFSLNRSITRK